MINSTDQRPSARAGALAEDLRSLVGKLKRRLREQQPFILEVLRGQKIYVLGDETDLEKVSGEELNQLAG